MTRYLLLFDSYGLVIVVRPLRREDGSVFCQNHSTGLGSSLYSLGADPNRKHRQQFFIVLMGGCLAIARICQATHVPSRDCCLATVLHAILLCEGVCPVCINIKIMTFWHVILRSLVNRYG
jgi:hypothetical protein